MALLLPGGKPAFLLLVTHLASAVEIYTPGTLEALNGTDVRLKCTFQSRAPITQQLTVSWHFQSLAKGPTEFVFYYHEQAYPPERGHFSGRVTWDGNALKSDASIMIWNVSPRDNGTFHCLVKNPPDVDGVAGEIQLFVVLKVSFSEIHILALTIGGACLLMIAIVVVVVVCRQRRKARQGPKAETELSPNPRPCWRSCWRKRRRRRSPCSGSKAAAAAAADGRLEAAGASLHHLHSSSWL